MLACSPGPFSPHPTDSWFGPSVWDGAQGSWLLRSPYWPPSSLSRSHLDPKGHSANFLPAGAGAGEWEPGGGGAVVRSPLDSKAGVHLQTDVSNESPGTRRAEAAEAWQGEVTVNYFPAAPPPLSTTLSPKSPGPQEQENETYVGVRRWGAGPALLLLPAPLSVLE